MAYVCGANERVCTIHVHEHLIARTHAPAQSWYAKSLYGHGWGFGPRSESIPLFPHTVFGWIRLTSDNQSACPAVLDLRGPGSLRPMKSACATAISTAPATSTERFVRIQDRGGGISRHLRSRKCQHRHCLLTPFAASIESSAARLWWIMAPRALNVPGRYFHCGMATVSDEGTLPTGICLREGGGLGAVRAGQISAT